MERLQNIKIVGRVGPSDNPALLCEIPQSLAAHIEIDSQGQVDTFDMIKILRRAYIKQVSQKTLDSNGLSQSEREYLYKKIFDKTLAIEPKNNFKNQENPSQTSQTSQTIQRKAS